MPVRRWARTLGAARWVPRTCGSGVIRVAAGGGTLHKVSCQRLLTIGLESTAKSVDGHAGPLALSDELAVKGHEFAAYYGVTRGVL